MTIVQNNIVIVLLVFSSVTESALDKHFNVSRGIKLFLSF
jgi:hypothetical protein